MTGAGGEKGGGGRRSCGPVVAVDGPSGVGKSTAARGLAGRLGLRYVDTGAMYRALALAAVDAGVDLTSDAELREFCFGAEMDLDPETGRVSVNGTDYTGRIRTEEAGGYASLASARPPVREMLTNLQRELAREGGVVMEGRDIGTVVLPDADIKFFLDASAEVRAARRHGEIAAKGDRGADLKEITSRMAGRDERDRSRKAAPLRKAPDAILVDTGSLDAEEVLATLLGYMRGRGIIEGGPD